MTFVRPSTQTNTTGAYTYKSGISSPSQNYIDNQFPNAIDGVNGGTYAGTLILVGNNTYAGNNYFTGNNAFSGATNTFTAVEATNITCSSTAAFSGAVNLYGDTFANNFSFYGATTTSLDNNAPVLLSSVTRNIAQPLVLVTSATYSQASGVSFFDTASSTYSLMLTNVPNGAVITGFSIGIKTDTNSPTSSDATATLVVVDNTTGTFSNSSATYTFPSGQPSNTFSFHTSSSCSLTVNTAIYSYYVVIQSSSTYPLHWCAPVISTTIFNIAQLA